VRSLVRPACRCASRRPETWPGLPRSEKKKKGSRGATAPSAFGLGWSTGARRPPTGAFEGGGGNGRFRTRILSPERPGRRCGPSSVVPVRGIGGRIARAPPVAGAGRSTRGAGERGFMWWWSRCGTRGPAGVVASSAEGPGPPPTARVRQEPEPSHEQGPGEAEPGAGFALLRGYKASAGSQKRNRVSAGEGGRPTACGRHSHRDPRCDPRGHRGGCPGTPGPPPPGRPPPFGGGPTARRGIARVDRGQAGSWVRAAPGVCRRSAAFFPGRGTPAPSRAAPKRPDGHRRLQTGKSGGRKGPVLLFGPVPGRTGNAAGVGCYAVIHTGAGTPGLHVSRCRSGATSRKKPGTAGPLVRAPTIGLSPRRAGARAAAKKNWLGPQGAGADCFQLARPVRWGRETRFSR